jgi:hypothetical protein
MSNLWNDLATEVISQRTGLAGKAPLASPSFTGTPTAPTAAPGTNTTQIATTAFTKTAIDSAVTGLLDFKGSTNCSGNPNYPAALKGDAYIVSGAGKIGGASGKSVDVGDVYLASADNAGGTEASVGTNWFVLEHNLVGALLSANNLSDLASAATARSNLGLAIGTDVEAHDSDLTAIAGLSPSNDDLIQRKSGAWTNRIMAQLLGDLITNGLTWTDVTFTNSWANYSLGYSACQYTKVFGVILIKGLITGGSAGNSAFTLPSGYRPARVEIFGPKSESAQADVRVNTDGTVVPAAFTGSWLSLNGILFPIA